ncbi:KH domain-containing protein HEN4 isoform X2 [Pyrus x bretschneideri]|uniref:KH domain-containing protein HEN4 isoform X2 n=1 Tax=Pyrus x bretschneideri TaxID=225117 RepID=UPI00202F9FB2|nr:KH domain-containing protein HEN4 isoform X2 [Pyrus x bretschneideri]
MGSTFLSLPAKRSLSTMSSDPNPYFENGSSKRSRPLPPPISVPPAHVAFRMLCHASRIGGVIGKSGAVIKQLQKTTGAKIRIEEPQVESPDRVVVIIAPSTIRSKIWLKTPALGNVNNGGGGGVEEEIDVSKAQEALLRVFERILEVAAETGAIAAGVGVVSCRFLAEAAQVGSVIGKGGKVVEKIRKETGCKIRVLNEKLPACAAATDEMIEIEGDILAVKKALVAVSGCLQDCPPVDKTRMTGSRPEAVPRETLPDLRLDQLSQRNSMLNLPISSMSYATGVRPSSIEAKRIPTLETKQQEVSFRILCANDRIGGVIGRGGSIVRALQNETGASISIAASVAECDERLITVSASENPESMYSPAQKAAVLVFSRSVEAGIEKGRDSSSNKGSPLTARLVVPSNQVGCLLGKGGAIVSEIRKQTGTGIRIIGGDQVPKCALENDEVVQISGDFSNVQDALYNITGRLRDNLFSSTVSNFGRRSSSSMLSSTDTSPYGRPRDPSLIGFQQSSSVGVPHGLSHHTTLIQSMDHLGLSHSLDHPSPPIPWASQMAAFTDVGRGLTSLKSGTEIGSGSKSAIVTNTTVEIVVPENVIGSVYGENGTNLARLRQISGAKVIVHEPRPGTTDRIIVISGTPDETQAAQSLLHAFILTGPSLQLVGFETCLKAKTPVAW